MTVNTTYCFAASVMRCFQVVSCLQAAAAFLSQPNPGKYSAPGYSTDFNSMSPSSNPGLPASPLIGAATYSAGGLNGYELQRVRDELVANKMKLSQWEDGIAQARSVSRPCSYFVLSNTVSRFQNLNSMTIL